MCFSQASINHACEAEQTLESRMGKHEMRGLESVRSYWGKSGMRLKWNHTKIKANK